MEEIRIKHVIKSELYKRFVDVREGKIHDDEIIFLILKRIYNSDNGIMIFEGDLHSNLLRVLNKFSIEMKELKEINTALKKKEFYVNRDFVEWKKMMDSFPPISYNY